MLPINFLRGVIDISVKLIDEIYFFFAFPIIIVKGQHQQIDLSFGSAITTDNFHWSIAGDVNGKNPNVYSEIKFNNIIRVGGDIKAELDVLPFVSATLFFGRYYTLNGRGTDIDYLGNDRTMESYHLAFLSKKGRMNIYKFGFLFPFLQRDMMHLSVGASSVLCYQVFYLNSDEVPELNSTYSPKKSGYGIAASAIIILPLDYTIKLKAEAHRIDYKASGNWNLIVDFEHPTSFRHNSQGFNIATNLEISKRIVRNIAIFVDVDLVYDKIGNGIDVLYQKGGLETITRFNGSISNSTMVGLGCSLNFNFIK